MLQPRQDSNANYAQGLDLKNAGNCKAAIEKLRPVANLGPGYENAQTALGACLLVVGMKDGETTADYLDGMMWLRRAADAGWPEAQGALAEVHFQGPAMLRNGVEAAYWLTLYQVNQGKIHIGFVPQKNADAMERALSPADKAAGVERARLWRRQIWLPPQQPAGGPEAGPDGGRGPRGGRRQREGA